MKKSSPTYFFFPSGEDNENTPHAWIFTRFCKKDDAGLFSTAPRFFGGETPKKTRQHLWGFQFCRQFISVGSRRKNAILLTCRGVNSAIDADVSYYAALSNNPLQYMVVYHDCGEVPRLLTSLLPAQPARYNTRRSTMLLFAINSAVRDTLISAYYSGVSYQYS